MKTRKIILASIAVSVAIFLFLSSGLKLPVLESTTDDYFRESITTAGVAYATCRVINASVSIVKNSSLNMAPAGVGVTLAIGQALDPIDDLTERVSDVLVTAITSLGVQKLVFEIGTSIAPPMLAVLLCIYSILILVENNKLALLQTNIMRLILFIIIFRSALPLSSLANNYLQEHFFADKISNTNKELVLSASEIDKLMKFSPPDIDGILGTIKNNASFLQNKSIEFKNAIALTVSNAGNIVNNLLKLAFLYAGVFIIQVIALPIIVFWLLIKFANSLFYKKISVMMPHNYVG
ncbi:MAG: hypothetical protein PHI97_14945 [Desulfobulbus sp.]|nr:hypothetical protein [Desulfobulbus sp.]